MTVTQNFLSNVLYPGGGPSCKVVTYDPYPSGLPPINVSEGEFGDIFKVNINAKTALDYIWNLESWSVDFDASGSINPDPDFYSSGDHSGTYTIDGQLHSASINAGRYFGSSIFNAEAHVLKSEPRDNICGSTYKTLRDYDGSLTPATDTINHSSDHKTILMPFLSLSSNFSEGDGVTVSDSFNIEDESSNVVGDVSFTKNAYSAVSGFGDLFDYVGAEVKYVRFLGNGTSDVYIRFIFSFSSLLGEFIRLQNNNTTSPGPSYGIGNPGDNNEDGTSQSVTLTIFGQSVTGYVWHRGPWDGIDTFATSTFDSFTGTLAITTNNLYTYS